MKTKECRGCGQEFRLKRSNGPKELEKRKFCSRECSSLAQSIGIEQQPIKTCANATCGKEFYKPARQGANVWANRKYCCQPCSVEAIGRAKRERLAEDVAWIVDHDHPHSVAQRVGYGNVDDLINKLHRNGHPQLAEKLVRNLERWRAYTVSA